MNNQSSDKSFFDKVKSAAAAAGKKIVYPAFLLNTVLKKKTTPMMDKAIIVSAIAYLILPTDVVPDFIPLLGYVDDTAALLGAVKTVSHNITPEVEEEAKDDFEQFFGERPDATI